MSDNIIDFSKRRQERMQSQPVSEVSMESLLQGLMSTPRNDLMADVAMSVREKLTRLLIMTDIASKASEMLGAYGFDPNNFYLESESLERYLSGDTEGGEVLWNGPFFDWDADDECNTTVRVATTVRTVEEEDDDLSIQLALDLLKLGENDENWSRFNDGEWVQDGPPADYFDMPGFWDMDDDDDDDDGDGDDDDDWYDDDDENSIFMHDFGPVALKALTLAGVDTVDQLRAMTDEQLAATPGLTEKELKRIRTVLSLEDEIENLPS